VKGEGDCYEDITTVRVTTPRLKCFHSVFNNVLIFKGLRHQYLRVILNSAELDAGDAFLEILWAD